MATSIGNPSNEPVWSAGRSALTRCDVGHVGPTGSVIGRSLVAVVRSPAGETMLLGSGRRWVQE